MTGTRRGNRESWIRETPNGRGYYEARVWMGTRPDGKPDRRHVERKTLKAVRARVRELERERDAGMAGKPGRPRTVREMLTRHLDVVLPQRGRAPKTITSYRSLCEHQIFPGGAASGLTVCCRSTSRTATRRCSPVSLSASTIVKVHAILSSAYEIEVRRGNVARNPCRLVEPPRLAQAGKAALTVTQARAVLAAAKERRNAARWSVGLACGLRQGEALGLRWPFLDIDVPDGQPGEARVWYQLQRLPWRHGCADPAACSERLAQAALPEALPEGPPGRPAAGTSACPSGAKRLCPPGCTGHAAQCPERQGGGLVFREIKERRRKTVPLPSPLVRLLQDAPGTAEPRAARRGERVGGLRRRLRPGERTAAGPARRLAGVVGHPRGGGHPARGHARHAALGRHDRARRGNRARRRPGAARPF